MQLDANGLAALAAWFAVAVTLYAVRSQITESRKQSSTQLYLRLFEQYESQYMQSKRCKLAMELSANRGAVSIDDTVLVYFETLGLMLRTGLVDARMVWYTFSVDAFSYWQLARHYIEHVRAEFSDATMFDEFEGLVNRLRELDAKLAPGALAGESEVTLGRFLQWEIQRLQPT